MAKNSKNKYSHTVLLPQTEFPMRAGLTQKEPKILEFWQKMNLYEAMLKKNEAGKHFILHDGPPYANGKIHIGHALDKTIKDIIIEINRLEEDGDQLYISVMKNLHATSKDPIEIIAWRDIYKAFENVCDYCEDVANIVESIVIGNL